MKAKALASRSCLPAKMNEHGTRCLQKVILGSATAGLMMDTKPQTGNNHAPLNDRAV